MSKFIHIGFPKTASTFLQNYYFTKNPKLNYLNKLYQDEFIIQNIHNIFAKNLFKLNDNFQELIKDPNSNYDIKFNKMKNLSEMNINELSNLHKHEIVSLYSNEKFLDITHLIGVKRKDFVEKFYKYFHEFKIIIVIREHVSFLNSLYNENQNHRVLTGGKNIDPKCWLNMIKSEGYFEFLEYYELIKDLQNKFGEKNVCVLFYENLKNTPYAFIEKLSKFMKIEMYYDESAFSNKINTIRTQNIIKYNIFKKKNSIIKFKKIIPNKIRKIFNSIMFQILSSSKKISHFDIDTQKNLRRKFESDRMKMQEIFCEIKKLENW